AAAGRAQPLRASSNTRRRVMYDFPRPGPVPAHRLRSRAPRVPAPRRRGPVPITEGGHMPLDDHTRAFLTKANLNPPAAPGSMPLGASGGPAAALRPLGWDREELAEVRDVMIPVAGAPDVLVRLYRPDVPGTPPLLVCVHGGSWVRLTVEMQDE